MGLRHPAGYRWMIVAKSSYNAAEWVLDGSDDRARTEARLDWWQRRNVAEWQGEFTFRMMEASP